MFLKGKNIEEYEGFSYRLVKAAIAKGINDTTSLANKLDDNKICKSLIKIRNKPKKKVEKKGENKGVNTDPLSGVKRNIQKHLNTKDAYNIPSQYLYAYSILLDCSIDYLYGKTEIMTADLEVVDICQKTGLSEDAVNCLIDCKSKEFGDSEDDSFSYSLWWSDFLKGDNFTLIPLAWVYYASILLKIEKEDKKIKALERAEKKVELSDVVLNLLLNEDGDYKTSQRELEKNYNALLGARHIMFTYLEEYLVRKANMWVEEQLSHDKDEVYKKTVKIRKKMKEQEK